MVREVSIVLEYEKHGDGCYYIRSNSIPGFRLQGPDFDALHRDLNPVVTDLLRHNMGMDVESIRWVPSPEEVKQHLHRPADSGTVTYVAQVKVAA